MDFLILVLAGSVAGAVTGLVPGLHVNTIAAAALAIVPDANVEAAVVLLAVGVVHTIVNVLPGTYLGVPDDDGVSMLPAHRLLLQGRGPEAVRVSVFASVAGIMLAGATSFALRPTFAWVAARMDDALAPTLIVALAWLALHDARRDWRRSGPIAAIMVAAGATGWYAFQLPLHPWVPVDPSPLLPLLAGLFGAAGLTRAWQTNRPIPTQSPAPPPRVHAATIVAACGASAATAIVPGVTSSVASSLVPRIAHHPTRLVAAMSTINSAHAMFAVTIWMSIGRTRSGLAGALDASVTAPWVSVAPAGAAGVLLAGAVAAAAFGGATTIAFDEGVSRHIHRIPRRVLPGLGLAMTTSIVAILAGWVGLGLYAIATLVGRLPFHFGVRRVHLVAALMGPIIVWRW